MNLLAACGFFWCFVGVNLGHGPPNLEGKDNKKKRYLLVKPSPISLYDLSLFVLARQVFHL
jgi:hypothetical protein